MGKTCPTVNWDAHAACNARIRELEAANARLVELCDESAGLFADEGQKREIAEAQVKRLTEALQSARRANKGH